MRVAFIFFLVASCVAGIGLSALPHRESGDRRRPRLLAMALAGLTLSLVCVGLVSHTFLRHLLQVAPPVFALVLVLRGSPASSAAAIPLLTFWLGVMLSIWLFLLGVVRIISGHFTATEIALTVVIALMCGFGLFGAMRCRATLGVGRRVATGALFAVLQFGALWLSLQPLALFR
jgi:hypothetical protein